MGVNRAFKFDAVKVLVLDEADRLLDLGFATQVHTIIDVRWRVNHTLTKRQSAAVAMST